MRELPFAAFKILCLWFLTVWLWCVSVWVSLSLSYLEFVELLGYIDLYLLLDGDIFYHYIFKYSFCPLSPLFLGLSSVCWSLWWCPTSPLAFAHWFFFSLFFLLLSLDNYIWTLFKSLLLLSARIFGWTPLVSFFVSVMYFLAPNLCLVPFTNLNLCWSSPLIRTLLSWCPSVLCPWFPFTLWACLRQLI